MRRQYTVYEHAKPHVIDYRKGKERFVYVFDDSAIPSIVQSIQQQIRNPSLDLDVLEAVMLCQVLHELRPVDHE